MIRLRAAIAAMVLLVCASFAIGAKSQTEDQPVNLLIHNARIFDGTGAAAFNGNVLIEGDRIISVGPDVKAPFGTPTVDAKGATLLPGLHDLHTHLRSPAYSAPEDLGKAWAGHLARGVTTVNDYSLSAEMLAPIREMTRQPGGIWAPHLNLAIRSGVPGGHGTEYGWGEHFTLEAATPRAGHLAMAQALPYQPDVIKVFADGWRYGRGPDLNSMDEPTLAAIVSDAHAAGVPVVTHTVTLRGAKTAAAAGVDSLVHGIGDAPIDDELLELMRKNGTSYVATMAVYEPRAGRKVSESELGALAPPELTRERRALAEPADAPSAAVARRWEMLTGNLRRMREAQVPVGIGTDAGIGGVYHGSSAIREIILLVRNGYTPADALLAATSISAAIMGQDHDHGTIAPGMRADLLLVDGRPDERIEDIWNVSRVWLSGRAVPLERLRARLADPAMTPLPVHRMTGPIFTGTRTDGRTDLDTLPIGITDAGADHSYIGFVQHGGEVGDDNPAEERAIFSLASFGANPQPFAALVLPLTRGRIDLADARGFEGIAFRARGAGSYLLSVQSYGLRSGDWFGATFTAGAESQLVKIPFADLRSEGSAGTLNLASLQALHFELAGEPGGRAWLELADVRFY